MLQFQWAGMVLIPCQRICLADAVHTASHLPTPYVKSAEIVTRRHVLHSGHKRRFRSLCEADWRSGMVVGRDSSIFLEGNTRYLVSAPKVTILFQNEKWVPPADHHDTRGQFDPSVHGTAGFIQTSISGFQYPIFQSKVLQTTKELPDVFPFNLDMNSGKPLGLGWLQYTIGHGRRSSSATSYLAPEFIRRENLHVLLHAQVAKLVDLRNATGTLSFGGVQFLQGSAILRLPLGRSTHAWAGTSQFTATASKEIVLSAGTVGTPNILMHSGIGDQSILNALGIPTLLHLPSVGQNVSDQPAFAASWAVNFNQTMELVTQNTTRFNEAFAEWNRSHTGPLVDFSPTYVAWLRLDADSPIFENHTDPSAGLDTPHIELAITVRGFLTAVHDLIYTGSLAWLASGPASRDTS